MFCWSLLEGKRKVAEEDKDNSGQVGGRKRSTREEVLDRAWEPEGEEGPLPGWLLRSGLV